MRPTCRSRLVVDPVWRLIDATHLATLFGRLTKEARDCGFVGLDLEWTTVEQPVERVTDDGMGVSDRKRVRPKRVEGPVATVQLSSASTTVIVKYCDLVALHQGTLVDPLLPDSRDWPNHRVGARQNCAALLSRILGDVNDLLADASVAKVGVGIFGDKAKLEADYKATGVTVEGCVDLVALASRYLAEHEEVRPVGEPDAVPVRSIRSLKAMCSAFAGRSLDKDYFVVCSAWGSGLGALSPLQIQYAAADAEASFDACAGILSRAGLATFDASSTSQLPPCAAFLAPLIGKAVLPQWQHCKGGMRTAVQSDRPAAAVAETGDWCKGRDKPYYDNINVFDPDMNLVFTVDKSKAEWYVHKKGLATVVAWRDASETAAAAASASDEDAAQDKSNREIAAIKLCFAPDFRKYNDAHIRRNLDYFKQPKENVCVVCGGGDKLVRFAVVPLMYRKYFPSVYMSHNSYDLLLVCTTCFARSRSIYAAEKAAIADDFGIPIGHLTTKTAPLYDATIAAKEASLSADVAGFREDPHDTVAHHLHPQQVLDAMREYRALEQHRECILNVFKYAKALRQHYASSQALEPNASAAGPLAVTMAASSRRYTGRRSRKLSARVGAVTNDGTQIPEPRLTELRDYIDLHAPTYPFYDANMASQAEQDAIFAEKKPSSVEGIELIMTGHCSRTDRVSRADTGNSDDVDSISEAHDQKIGGDSDVIGTRTAPVVSMERSYHSVLTMYWLTLHPELRALLPSTTREDERRRDQCAPEDDEGDPDKLPYVDNHGFLLVRMLLQKYQKNSASGKNGEHAVGQFIYRWRTAFLSRLQPQHLPSGWVAEDGILM